MAIAEPALVLLALLGAACNRSAAVPAPDAVSSRVVAPPKVEPPAPGDCGPSPADAPSGQGGAGVKPAGGAGARAASDASLPGGSADAAVGHGEPGAVATVILISVDGLAARFIEELDALGELPGFARLRDEGASTLNARTEARISVTIPNHVSMISSRPAQPVPELGPDVPHGVIYNIDPGGDSTIHDENPELGYVASAFDEAHDRGGHTWLYSGKDKFELFRRSYSAPHARPDVIGEDDGDDKIDDFLIVWETDELVASFLEALADGVRARPSGPNFGMLHLRDTDSEGHGLGWGGEEYLAALRRVDGLLGELLDFVTSSEALAGTAIVLTTDHGGVDYGHNDHTDPLVHRIPFFVWGPGVPRGVDLYAVCGPARRDPGSEAPLDGFSPQPVRNGDAGNLALALLGIPPLEGSLHQGLQIDVSEPECTPRDAGAVPGTPVADAAGGAPTEAVDASPAPWVDASTGPKAPSLDASLPFDGGPERDAAGADAASPSDAAESVAAPP